MPQTTVSERPRGLKPAALAMAVLLGMGIGLLLGWLAGSAMTSMPKDRKRLLDVAERIARDKFKTLDKDDAIVKILKTVDVDNMKEQLRKITSQPHLAGTAGDTELATYIRDQWISNGLDDVTMVPYDVLLSYPDPKRPNKVEIVSATKREILYTSTLPPSPSNWNEYPYPYFAYSPNGTVEGHPVFANYGTEDDFRTLDELGVTVAGSIIIMKHGRAPCGKKVELAEQLGAIGVLVYPDPEDMAMSGTGSEMVYPNSWWLPADGIVRATVRDELGDPLTPGYPSIKSVHRQPSSDAHFSKIPSQPINYQDALEILGKMGGAKAPDSWTGGLDIQYMLGPGFQRRFQTMRLRLTVNNHLKRVESYNVIGYIYGADEPDKNVIMGNHRDAWTEGAIDPGSGTTVTLELTRILGKLKRTGWKPRRSLIFCSWGAEEFGLIGSTEWVEEHVLTLQQSAVTYVNVDTCVAGDSFAPIMSPTLNTASIKISKMIPDPNDHEKTLYDGWLEHMTKSGEVHQDTGEIKFSPLGVYSDFAPFLYYAGVPVLDIYWQKKNPVQQNIYPAYHTSYETLLYLETFLDPKFRRHVSCTQFTGLMMLYLADSALLPFDFGELVAYVTHTLSMLDDNNDYLQERNISMLALQTARDGLNDQLESWNSYLEKSNHQNPYELRALNDHMLLLHKALLSRVSTGKQGKFSDFYRYGIEHSVFDILDLLESSNLEIEPAKLELTYSAIRRHLTNLHLMVHQLGALLTAKPYVPANYTNFS